IRPPPRSPLFPYTTLFRSGDTFRVVQLDPPGSACSIAVGMGITDAEPGSMRGLHLVVTDILAASEELVSRGVDVSEIRHMSETRSEEHTSELQSLAYLVCR